MKPFTALNYWAKLKEHAQSLQLLTFKCFNNQQKINKLAFRTTQSKLRTTHISLDFSHQHMNDTTLELLLKLANECELEAKIDALIQGKKINRSENRPALHTALRSFQNKSIIVDNHDIMPDVIATREKMSSISNQLRAGLWLGYTGLPITNIVNIGIGGSDLGARFCINAFASLRANHLHYHFISDIDPHSFTNIAAKLNPETTLFIVSSKSFTTEETLYNTRKAMAWIGNTKHINQHFIAITANNNKAKKIGITNILPIWEWVGGRYSLCSAINLITCIAIGYERFLALLEGANSMDRHFHTSALPENLPVIMALIGLWNINFLHIPSLLLLVYAKQLEQLVPYIQQLDMESNGKSIDMNGRVVNYMTAPIIWGGLGSQAQHSYYQLLCQGTHKIAADFISTKLFDNDLINTFCNTKIQVLSQGIPKLNSNGYIAGGMPINHLQLASCSPFCIGALIALYEHKVFTQSVLWNINPFDQPGVNSAKHLYTKSMLEPSLALDEY